jgi:hypothetical protein
LESKVGFSIYWFLEKKVNVINHNNLL